MPRPRYTHEVRTRVPEAIGAELEEEATREGVQKADIVRRALLERYPVTAEELRTQATAQP